MSFNDCSPNSRFRGNDVREPSLSLTLKQIKIKHNPSHITLNYRNKNKNAAIRNIPYLEIHLNRLSELALHKRR
jgi:hypothetical protein